MKIDVNLLDTTCASFKKFLGSLGYKQAHDVPIKGVHFPNAKGEQTPSFPLKWHTDPRGALIELWRGSWEYNNTDDSGVGQAYVSTTLPGVVKGWHCHLKQTDRFFCVRGKIMLVTWDAREAFMNDGPLFTFETKVLEATRSPETVCIPPGVVHGWKALGNEEAWVLNLVSHEYDGTDEWRADPHSHEEYNWNRSVDG